MLFSNQTAAGDHLLRKLAAPACAALILLLSACDSDGDGLDIDIVVDIDDGEDAASEDALIQSDVVAAEGGVFASPDGAISIDIPADALAEDAELLVLPVEGLSDPTDNMTSAGDAFEISFGAPLLSQVAVSLQIEQAPLHPELAETAAIEQGEWVRSDANFFRASDSTVISLIDADVTLQPIFRTLVLR